MKRSVRSGIAIAGMAGGFWLLGQAVANAADTPPANTADSSAVLTSTTGGGTGGGSADSDNSQNTTAKNDVDNTATTGPIDASGGKSSVAVVAGNGNTVGASSDKGTVDAKQTVTTVVWISSEANGGTVSGSNNASAGNGASNSATASSTLKSTTEGGSAKNGGKADSDNSQNTTAKNDVDNTATTGPIDASGGKSSVAVVAGNGNDVGASSGRVSAWTTSQDKKCKDNYRHQHQSGNVKGSQTVDTKVTVSSEANGGKVSDSNNAWSGNGGSNAAHATGTLTSNTEGGSGKNGGKADSDNSQDTTAKNDVDNTATTGPIDVGGGMSTVGVIAGNGNTLYCTSKSGNVTCSQNITTIINIISQANGGSVSCSNNASAGNAGSAVCPVTNHTSNTSKGNTSKGNTSNTPVKAAAPSAHKAAAAPAGMKAAVSASAQPSGTLAFTGAETSLPLTLGLLALGAGGALTLAGRRRETATV